MDRFLAEIVELKVYIVRATEKCCCTCTFWTGLRAGGDSGFIYSLEEQDGICRFDGQAIEHALKHPGEVCDAWQLAAEIA